MLGLIFKPFGCLFSLFSSLLFILLIILGIAYWGLHYALPGFVESKVSDYTYFNAKIADPDSSLLDARIRFNDVSIYNPVPEFPTSDFLYFKEISIDVDPTTVGSQTKIIEEIVINLDRLTWSNNDKGEANITKFVNRFKASKSGQAKDGTWGSEAGSEMDFIIRRLTVSIQSAQLWKGGAPSKRIDMNYSRTFTDITELDSVVKTLSYDLKNQGLNALFGSFFKAYIQSGSSESTREGQNIGDQLLESGKKATDMLQDKLKGLFNK